MIASASRSSAALTIVLDIRSPQAYLALQPAMAFAQARQIDVNWLPMSVSSLKPPTTATDADDRGVAHRRFRALQIAREIEIYAEGQGLLLREIYRVGDSTAFNLGWLWMREHGSERLEEFLAEAFRAYWAVAFDPASTQEVGKLIDALGGGSEGYRDWCGGEGSAVLASNVETLHDQGVFGVPSYLVEEEIFLGRQHLSMIDWIMTGRCADVPI